MKSFERIKKLWDEAQRYSKGLPEEERSVSRTVGFYDCLCRKEKLESTMAEGQQQGEGVKRDLGFAKWLEENTKVIYEPKITLYRFYDNLDGWGNYILDDIYTVYDEKYNYAEDSNAVKECDARDGDSSTFADIINFLEKIDSSSMSDKTWLAEQKNLRQEGKELMERLTGKEIEEVIVKLKK